MQQTSVSKVISRVPGLPGGEDCIDHVSMLPACDRQMDRRMALPLPKSHSSVAECGKKGVRFG